MLNKKDKLLAAAQKFLERGSLDKALVEFQKAAQEDAKDTRTWLRIAEIHVKRGEATQATQVYLKTAELYVEQGFFQRAAAVYKNVLKLTPGHTDAHTKLAEVYRQLGLLSDSSQQYEQAATAFAKAGNAKQAMAALSQILEMNPDQVMVRVKIGEVAAQAGLTEDAVREFGKAADHLEQQGRTDDFLRVAERLLQIDPNNTAVGKRAAVRYMERQNPEGGSCQAPGLLQHRQQGQRDPAAPGQLLCRARADRQDHHGLEGAGQGAGGTATARRAGRDDSAHSRTRSQ